MTISIDEVRAAFGALSLQEGSIVVEPHEAAIGDDAFRAEDHGDGVAHPAWFVIASLRGMGFTVDDLCAAAGQEDGDVLLFGSCDIEQESPLQVGDTYLTRSSIGSIGSRSLSSGARLDHVDVVVEVSSPDDGNLKGRITSRYLFKRAVAA